MGDHAEFQDFQYIKGEQMFVLILRKHIELRFQVHGQHCLYFKIVKNGHLNKLVASFLPMALKAIYFIDSLYTLSMIVFV